MSKIIGNTTATPILFPKEDTSNEKKIVLSNRLSYGLYELPADCVGIKDITVEWNATITSSDFSYVLLCDRKPTSEDKLNDAVHSVLYKYADGLTQKITLEGFENRPDIRYIFSYTDVGESGIVSITYYIKTKAEEYADAKLKEANLYTDTAIQQAILDSWEVGI